MKLNNTNVIITVDLSQVTGPGTWNLSYDFELPETVTSSGISVVGRSKTSVEVKVDKLSAKEIVVEAVFEGDVASGYVSEPIKLEYETIEIRGPKELVDSVDYAQVVLKRTNLSKSVSEVLDYTLMDAEDEPVESDEIKCSVDQIGVEMPVLMVKDVALTVTLIAGGGATEDHAVCTVEPSTISVKGDPTELEALNSINVGTIDLASVQKTESKNFDIVIPNGMTNLTGETAAKVTVETEEFEDQNLPGHQ